MAWSARTNTFSLCSMYLACTRGLKHTSFCRRKFYIAAEARLRNSFSASNVIHFRKFKRSFAVCVSVAVLCCSGWPFSVVDTQNIARNEIQWREWRRLTTIAYYSFKCMKAIKFTAPKQEICIFI